MQPYLTVFQNSLSEFFVYRLNFVLWRIRTVITLLVKYFLWLAVFEAGKTIFGYSEGEMLTYILFSSLISNFVLATKTPEIASHIISGSIIVFLLRPVSFFKYHITREFADKSLNLIFTIIETAIIILIFKPDLFIQTDPKIYLIMIPFIIIGTIIAYFINLSLSFLGFWTPETWAPRFIFFMLILFFSGGFFPLDILPRTLYLLLFLTPFPYLYFLPTKIYLGVPEGEIIFFFVLSLTWLSLTYLFARTMWKKGLKDFSFFGR